MAAVPTIPACHVCQGRVSSLQRKADHAECLLANGSKVQVSRFLAAHITNGDEIAFPLFTSPVNRGPELYVATNAHSGHVRDPYQASIGYVTQPRKNKRDQLFASRFAREASASPQSSCHARFCTTTSTVFHEVAVLRLNPLSTMCCGFRLALLPLNFASRTNCGLWNSIPPTLLTVSVLSWSERSTFWLSQISVPSMTRA